MMVANATSLDDATSGAIARNVVMISCCLCGVLMEPNPCNTCAMCLASSSDVTRGISSEATLHQCRGCHRWHAGGSNGVTDVNAGKWVAADLESRELMSLCLSKVSGLSKNKKKDSILRLVDAAWIWTEPHCMRLKVRITVQKEVHAGTILQQSLVVTFVIRNMQCMDCQAVYRQGSWKSLVQVRQRVSHKRTFLYLEQLILKHGAHRGCLSIQTFRDGMDFYFADKQKAARFISFLENVVPMKIKTSKKLIGTDDKNNVSNYKYTNFVEICPLCKDDLVYLPKKVATNMGNIARCVLVKNISNLIHFVDPLTGQTGSMSSDVYWRNPFSPIVTAGRSRLTRFVILGKEPVVVETNKSKRQIRSKAANRVALLTVAKERDLGRNNLRIEQISHFGYLFKAGDVCLGYDLQSDIQIVDDEAFEHKEKGNLPDAIIVRKLYGATTEEETKQKQRIWALQKFVVTEEEDKEKARQSKKDKELNDIDEEDFFQEVEADKEMRSNMFLYKTELAKKQREAEEEEEEEEEDDDQRVQLDELLDGLVLDYEPKDDAMLDGEEEEDDNIVVGDRANKDGINYIGREDARAIASKEVAMPVGSTFGEEFFAKGFKFT